MLASGCRVFIVVEGDGTGISSTSRTATSPQEQSRTRVNQSVAYDDNISFLEAEARQQEIALYHLFQTLFTFIL
jgi:hypothetical protein